MANVGKFKDCICRSCKMRGHIARACRSKGKSKLSEKVDENNLEASNKQYLPNEQIDEKEEAEEVYYIHKVVFNNNPYRIKLQVENKMVPFEIDTGAGLTFEAEAC